MEEEVSVEDVLASVQNIINLDNNMTDTITISNHENLINLLKYLDEQKIPTTIEPGTLTTTFTKTPTTIEPKNLTTFKTPTGCTIPEILPTKSIECTMTNPEEEQLKFNNVERGTSGGNILNYKSNNKTIKIYNLNTLSDESVKNNNVNGNSFINSNKNIPIINKEKILNPQIVTNQVLQTLTNIPINPDQTHRLVKIRLYCVLDLCKNQNTYNNILFSHQDLHTFVINKWVLYNQNYNYYLQTVQKHPNYNSIFKNVIGFCQQQPHPMLYLQVFIICQITNYINVNNEFTEQEMYLLQLRLGFLISNFNELYHYAYTIKTLYMIKNYNINDLLNAQHLHLNHHIHDFQMLYETPQKLNNVGMNLYSQINKNSNFKIVFNLQVYNFINEFLKRYY